MLRQDTQKGLEIHWSLILFYNVDIIGLFQCPQVSGGVFREEVFLKTEKPASRTKAGYFLYEPFNRTIKLMKNSKQYFLSVQVVLFFVVVFFYFIRKNQLPSQSLKSSHQGRI